jgi:CubicO group peptidase (beta-lactamase class C family)
VRGDQAIFQWKIARPSRTPPMAAGRTAQSGLGPKRDQETHCVSPACARGIGFSARTVARDLETRYPLLISRGGPISFRVRHLQEEPQMSENEPFDTSSHLDLKLMQGFPPPPDKRVTPTNGLMPPFNRWAYQNMRQIWPTAPVRPAKVAVDVPRAIDPRIDTVQVTRPDGTAADLGTFLRQTLTDSFVVISKGQIIHESYLNGMTADQPHIMFSCTKSLAGLFALMAIEKGLVTEDTPIVSILPELNNGGAFATATFGQVLDMTASVRFSEEHADPAAEIRRYAAVFGAIPMAAGAPSPDSVYSFISELMMEPGRQHGEGFAYQTPMTDVLNWAVSRLTGQSFIDLLEQRIWSRIGTDGEAYVLLDPSGIIFAGGGLNATANDVARFAVMALSGGRFGKEQVIPASVFDTVARGGNTKAFLNGSSFEAEMADGHWSYRAQWWIRNTPGHEAFMALGVFGQWIYIDRARDVAIIKQSSQPKADSAYFFTYTLNAIDAVIRQVSDHASQG